MELKNCKLQNQNRKKDGKYHYNTEIHLKIN